MNISFEALDGGVGATVDLDLERGGKPLKERLSVGDLHAITPDRYLEIGDAVVHTLSWQMARHMNVPVRRAYVANPGYVFGPSGIPRGAVIVELAGQPVGSLDDATRILGARADGELVPVKYFTLEDTRSPQLKSLRVDRRWFQAHTCRRDDALGIWPCEDLAAPPAAAPEAPAATRFARTGDRVLDALAPSLVLVSFTMPYSVEGS